MSCYVKNEEYTKIQKDAAKYAKVLWHPVWVTILEVLAKKWNSIFNNLTESLPLAQSTVSQHLKIPKEAGLVEGIIKQPAIACHLNVYR